MHCIRPWTAPEQVNSATCRPVRHLRHRREQFHHPHYVPHTSMPTAADCPGNSLPLMAPTSSPTTLRSAPVHPSGRSPFRTRLQRSICFKIFFPRLHIGNAWTKSLPIFSKYPDGSILISGLHFTLWTWIEVYEYDFHFSFRVQAVNIVGVGPFNSVLKVTTKPLPPLPPKLELIGSNHNSLKLRWAPDIKLSLGDLIQYYLEMQTKQGR